MPQVKGDLKGCGVCGGCTGDSGRDCNSALPTHLMPLSPSCSHEGDCQTQEEAVVLGVGLCNNGFIHHCNPSLFLCPSLPCLPCLSLGASAPGTRVRLLLPVSPLHCSLWGQGSRGLPPCSQACMSFYTVLGTHCVPGLVLIAGAAVNRTGHSHVCTSKTQRTVSSGMFQGGGM